jgi:hypothetical protein
LPNTEAISLRNEDEIERRLCACKGKPVKYLLRIVVIGDAEKLEMTSELFRLPSLTIRRGLKALKGRDPP